MSDDGCSKNTTARSPFDDADADVVLHTSDHVDFRVFRLILTLSSPFFQGMFSLPQPNASPSSDAAHAAPSKPPSIDVPEDSASLDGLLRFLYPNTTPEPFTDLAHARSVALSASKYVMPAALDKIARAVEAQYAAPRPLEVYLLACRMGWEDVARGCARRCVDPTRMDVPELDDDREDALSFGGAGVAYHRLETYRLACHRAIEGRLEGMSLFDDDDEDGGCEEYQSDSEEDDDDDDDDDDEDDGRPGVSKHCLGRWTARYSANIRREVVKCPTRETLDDLSLTPDGECGRCDVHKMPSIATARINVASQIEAALTEVKLRFG